MALTEAARFLHARRRQGADKRLTSADLRYERVDVVVGAAVVFVPGLELVPVLVLTQVVNAVLLLPLLVVVQRFARDPELMGPYRSGRRATLAAAAAFAILAASVIGLALSVVPRG